MGLTEPTKSVVRFLIPALSGVLFGLGLMVAGMTDPRKVLNFLDVTGAWDPSLALVMLGALSVAVPGFWFVRQRSRPLADESFHLATIGKVDRNLVAGAAIFGIGWGLAGLCPGPAIVSTLMGSPAIHVFLPAMLMGVSTAVLMLTTGIPRAKIKPAHTD